MYRNVEKRRTYIREYQRKRRAAGLCSSCGNQARPGRATCSDCLSRSSVNFSKKQRERVANGKCGSCGNDAGGKWRCSECARKNSAKRVNLKKRAVELLGGKCVDCGGEFHYAAFDFYHLDRKAKVSEIATIMRSKQWGIVVSELAKCQLVCSNCHRVRTATQNRKH